MLVLSTICVVLHPHLTIFRFPSISCLMQLENLEEGQIRTGEGGEAELESPKKLELGSKYVSHHPPDP
jgi:hypothetical protein